MYILVYVIEYSALGVTFFGNYYCKDPCVHAWHAASPCCRWLLITA